MRARLWLRIVVGIVVLAIAGAAITWGWANLIELVDNSRNPPEIPAD